MPTSLSLCHEVKKLDISICVGVPFYDTVHPLNYLPEIAWSDALKTTISDFKLSLCTLFGVKVT